MDHFEAEHFSRSEGVRPPDTIAHYIPPQCAAAPIYAECRIR